jgi:hypothetical protein
MKKRKFETIIIGAGIAGLTCARKLHENGKEFLVISENIGGRILPSKDGKVNYGCYAIMDSHNRIKPLIKKCKKIHHSRIRYYKESENYQLFDKRLLIYIPQWFKLLFLLHKFKKHYDIYNKKCETVSQAQAIKSDPFLLKLYQQTAKELVQEYKIENITEDYLSFVVGSCAFVPFHNVRAFTFLHILLTAIVPPYEFYCPQEEMIKGFEKDIIIDSVIQITKKKNQYLVKTKTKNFWAKNLVVATPPHESAKLLHLKKINKATYSHIFHISGKLSNFLRDIDVAFFSDNNIWAIYRQDDGSHIVNSKTKQPKFKKYFKKSQIIKYKFWNPAFHPVGHVLWECEQDKNLYLIGDHNECCLEDAYVTGLYAASRIIGSK